MSRDQNISSTRVLLENTWAKHGGVFSFKWGTETDSYLWKLMKMKKSDKKTDENDEIWKLIKMKKWRNKKWKQFFDTSKKVLKIFTEF